MSRTTTSHDAPGDVTHARAPGVLARLDARMPRLGVRGQLAAAASIWLIGATILLIRGVGYIHDRSWHVWALAAGLVLGVVKSRFILVRVATKAVARIRARGRASFLGFYSLPSWGFIALMMGGGIALRRIVTHPGPIVADLLGALYLGVGTALLLADRVYWHAALRDGQPGAHDGRPPQAA